MRTTITSLLLIAVLAGCGGGATPSENAGPAVVATTSILGDVARNVVETEGEVQVLMGTATDPHDFSPSARQAASIRSADLVIVNGLGLEAGMDDVIESAAAEGANILEVADMVDPIPFGDHGEEEGEHEEGEHEEEGHEHDEDPHFWMDPLRVAEAVGLISEELVAIAPDGGWAERGAFYQAELESLHAEIVAQLEAVPTDRRKLVTNHDALGYFADRYGFEVVATVIPGGDTLANPSASDLANVVEVLRREDVRVIFADTTAPTDLAEAVAAELGETVEVIELYTGSLGEEGSGADTYLGMMSLNASLIADGLGG